ncbi:MAG: heat-shock protein Hsp90 [Synergistales bacterium]|nr:heat-shock protein Hsp90 [Synergistales bacterium]MDY6400895.1 heat-shock protein Hsp90 [Synergistales bacterium]MDY6405399.1 heat-shock protein Hsp90 [Synergistales bacterium]MDY6410052.1 heat-shock protein Hsp90 [Synergistales bacterium]MDY6413702.1 heat-shock protein Hsp90 [Synergistales bacterium]
MTKNEIIEKVKELIAAPSCCEKVKNAAEAYLKAQDKATADALVKVLEEEVCSIDETIELAKSDFGKKLFGDEQAANMVKLGKELKAKGEKYCFCPACQAGSKIYENKEALA